MSAKRRRSSLEPPSSPTVDNARGPCNSVNPLHQPSPAAAGAVGPHTPPERFAGSNSTYIHYPTPITIPPRASDLKARLDLPLTLPFSLHTFTYNCCHISRAIYHFSFHTYTLHAHARHATRHAAFVSARPEPDASCDTSEQRESEAHSAERLQPVREVEAEEGVEAEWRRVT